MLKRSKRHRRLGGVALGVIALLGAIAACMGSSDDATVSTTSQAINPTPFDVMADADSAAKYADKCGLGTGAAATQLPELGTAAAPIRGTTRAADVGVLVSNGWKLIQMFDNNTACLASAAALKANLWHKRAGGRDWYYLYRFGDPNPTVVQTTLNGILGFDATSICAFDRISRALPATSLTDLFYAGETENPMQMDDCSSCHIQGYNAPREKTYIVAKGPSKRFPWMPAQWLPPWRAYAAAFGPQWKLGKAPTPGGYKWVSGQGTALVATAASCTGCHGANWVQPRDAAQYCGSVFETGFDANGSMTIQGNTFGTRAECNAFVGALGCNAAAVCATAVAAAAPPPLVNETTLLVGQVQVINRTTVKITPMQNPYNLWLSGMSSAIGDHWVTNLQVWGAPYSGGPTSTFPMSSVVSTPDPEALPDIYVTGLSPNTQYILQLRTVDRDFATAFSPTTTVYIPGDPPADAGVGRDAFGIDAASGSDASVGSDAMAGSDAL